MKNPVIILILLVPLSAFASNRFSIAGSTPGLVMKADTSTYFYTFPVLISSNPFSKQTEFILPCDSACTYKLEIYDITGKLVRQLDVNNGHYIFKRENLAAGIYLYVIKEDFYTLKTGKVIIADFKPIP